MPHPSRICKPTSNGHSIDHVKIWSEFRIGFSTIGVEAIAEDCPWCENDKLHLNTSSGQYHCKHCQEGGNLITFLTYQHKSLLESTTLDHYRKLTEKRGVATQSLRRHELAFDQVENRWLIPFKNTAKNVANIQFYYPDKLTKPSKVNLPGLDTYLFGVDKLSSDPKKILFLCEGAFDAIAISYSIGDNRGKYDILATPGGFKESWIEFFRGRKVRALFDNDEGGKNQTTRLKKVLGEGKVTEELRILSWPAGFEGYDINKLVKEKPDISILDFTLTNSIKVTQERSLTPTLGKNTSPPKKLDWIWPNRLPCGTYVSFSGTGGTGKSTVMLELAARYTSGRAMPFEEHPSMPAGHVYYLYAEDDEATIDERFEAYGGDFSKFHKQSGCINGESLNILEHLEEIREDIRTYQIRWVILDGQNSMVGSPNISTDMGARSAITNRLHHFAQEEGFCFSGVRNEDPKGRAMGPQSMADISRCIIRAIEDEPRQTPPSCRLTWVKVSNAPREDHPDIHYLIEKLENKTKTSTIPIIRWIASKSSPAKDLQQKLKEKRS